MIVGILKENESRVSVIPSDLAALKKMGVATILVGRHDEHLGEDDSDPDDQPEQDAVAHATGP